MASCLCVFFVRFSDKVIMHSFREIDGSRKEISYCIYFRLFTQFLIEYVFDVCVHLFDHLLFSTLYAIVELFYA